VTAGYITDDARPEFYRHMDAANVDLKAFTDTFYHRLCFAQLDPVLDTLKYLRHETNVWFEVTTLLIPGENDSEAELHRSAEWHSSSVLQARVARPSHRVVLRRRQQWRNRKRHRSHSFVGKVCRS
jgi:pyruvate-formate lyase-activating enzyme